MDASSLTPLPAEAWDLPAAAHLLNRAGFGGTPAEIAALHTRGLDAAVAWMLDFSRATPLKPEWAKPDPDRAAKLKLARNGTEEQRRELRKTQQQEQRRRILELQHAWLERMTTGPAPLQEKLTLFWHGHFATSIQKVRDAYLMWRQNDLFRRHAAGSWTDLLDAVTADPAMLLYLDQANSKPDHPNENYARELMELFTLGEGHFSESDVTEAARALTGLSYDRLLQDPVERPRLRDPKPKTLFGETGKFGARELVRLIVRQPAAAPHITGRLWTFFAGTEAAPELAQRLAAEFRSHGQQFAPFLRTLFRSQAFHAPTVRRQQIKSPVQFIVGACRHLERPLPPPIVCLNSLRLLGQELFNPPNVKGWDGGVAWINTTTLLNRHNLALLLTTGENVLPSSARAKAAGKKISRRQMFTRSASAAPALRLFSETDRESPETLLTATEQRLFQSRLPAKERATLLNFLEEHDDPDATEILGFLRLAMCTPEYQLT